MPRAAVLLVLLATAGCRGPAYPVTACGARFCLTIEAPQSLTGIGRPQSVDVRDGLVYVAADASTGVIGVFRLEGGTLARIDVYELTTGGQDRIAHATGLTSHESYGTWIGNGYYGDLFVVDWEVLRANRTLDGALLNYLIDDAAGHGSRPEFARVGDRWLIASADYQIPPDGRPNEVRLYDPEVLRGASRTDLPGAVVARIPAEPYVQSLYWWEDEALLVLLQNTRKYRGWRFVFLDLAPIAAGGDAIEVDVIEPPIENELEGFHLVTGSSGVVVTGKRSFNAHLATIGKR